jgi:hypothetical protein
VEKVPPRKFLERFAPPFAEELATVIFIEWWGIERLCLLVLIVVTASLIIWSVRKKRWFVRFPIQLFLGLFLFALLFLVRLISRLAGNTYSEPVY